MVKIEGSHQFVPTNTDPAEFKRKQKEVRLCRRRKAGALIMANDFHATQCWDSFHTLDHLFGIRRFMPYLASR